MSHPPSDVQAQLANARAEVARLKTQRRNQRRQILALQRELAEARELVKAALATRPEAPRISPPTMPTSEPGAPRRPVDAATFVLDSETWMAVLSGPGDTCEGCAFERAKKRGDQDGCAHATRVRVDGCCGVIWIQKR